ncbi:tRNA1(Val) (adenine(37)-N6)-methyltransferase [Marinobacterium nitratireducens]|uniref:tRNA1(Val) (Adenine(37)-N6)-methyltransferase n=2 Tax=Marinobacterium nitratireducens TaxID=518897 RepID=A0A917ZD26_9GAMM|nr:tRNA1(Val) (adenine(37)-N6)-methyltransferase [Marinobacterium nitratireducens]
MKVTTDASLLGAWAPVEDARRILDIGTGTGLLALFAAQRSSARIDAVEVDADAAAQARQNFAASPWADRLSLIEADVRELTPDGEGYDGILCNPPFFTASTPNRCDRQALARHNDALPLTDLLAAISRLLCDNGRAWLLLPVPEAGSVRARSPAAGLWVRHELHLRNDRQSPPHRLVLQLERRPGDCTRSDISLYERHPYHTQAAADLFRPYYTRLRVGPAPDCE